MRLPSNGKNSQLLLALTTLLLGSAAAGAADAACSITYGGLTSTLPNLGNVVSGTVGETVFTVAPQSGTITKTAGAGTRTSSGASIVSMTIQTANNKDCDNLVIQGTLTATTATNRGKTMRNFDVSTGGSLTVSNEAGTGSTRTFTLGMNKGQTGVLYIGMDFPIKGDDEGGATGSANLATSTYSLNLNAPNGNDTTVSGVGRATVRRSLRIVKTSDLSFGKIVRPSSGSSLVTLNATNGIRSMNGNAVGIEAPTASRGAYTVLGEAGQVVSITVPGSVSMTGPGTPLSVSLTAFRPPPQNQLLDIGGGNGSYDFWVGGSLTLSSTTATGSYSGVYTVTVAYN